MCVCVHTHMHAFVLCVHYCKQVSIQTWFKKMKERKDFCCFGYVIILIIVRSVWCRLCEKTLNKKETEHNLQNVYNFDLPGILYITTDNSHLTKDLNTRPECRNRLITDF